MQPIVVFTDLDGTLLNHHDYSYQDALPAINSLRARQIPLILVSSKTRAEMTDLCRELVIADPYVCENGSVIVLPKQWAEDFHVPPVGLVKEADCLLAYRGAQRDGIVTLLASLADCFDFTGFADMSVSDVVDVTGLDEASAVKAMQRDASEPLLWHDNEAAFNDFAQLLGEHNLRVLKGGRFYHVMASCDKGDAVRYLLRLYGSHYGAKVKSIALGDSPNDLIMLREVDQAVVIPHADGTIMHDHALINAINAPFAGAKGWRAGVEQALQRLQNNED